MKIFNTITVYLMSVGVVAQLAMMSMTKGLHLSANVVVLTLTILMLKLISYRNHFLGYLITIEVFMVMTCVSILFGYSYFNFYLIFDSHFGLRMFNVPFNVSEPIIIIPPHLVEEWEDWEEWNWDLDDDILDDLLGEDILDEELLRFLFP